ncbi:MAG: tetratricopeptide repeat protein [Acidobacteria bacterium]|nr:tetratricopeptide repeat protein [Acidobacteriota bacterium]
MPIRFLIPAAVCMLAAPICASAQQSSMAQFEDYARRAEAVLDSQPEQAVQLYRKALAIRPAWVDGWLYLGAALYQMNREAEATDAFRKGVALAPGHGMAWAFLGLAEAELDNAEQALADIRKGEELGLGANLEFEVAVRVKAARMLVLNSTFDEALAQLQPLSKKNVDSQAVAETMGLCALAMPRKISELTPEQRELVQLAGKAAWDTVSQRPVEAAAAYRQMLERYPSAPGVRYAHGLYLMETDLAGALGEFQAEVKNNPGNWPAQLMVASLYIRQGSADEALAALGEAMKRVPPHFRWICHAEMGRANLTGDRIEAAIPHFERAAGLMPANAQIHYYLSQAYRRAGRKEDAQRESALFQKLMAQQDPLGVPSLRPFAGGAGKN